MCNPTPKNPTSGFTILELMIAISIAGILMAIAIPNFSDMIRNNRLTTYTNELVTSLNIARSEAVKRGGSVTVGKIGGAGGAYWNNGWQVFVDTNADGVLDADEEVLKIFDKLPDSFTLVGHNFTGFVTKAGNSDFVNFVRYQADGTIGNTSSSRGSFILCDNSDGNNIPEPYTSRLVIVNMMGRIRVSIDRYDSQKAFKADGIPETDDGDKKTNLASCVPS